MKKGRFYQSDYYDYFVSHLGRCMEDEKNANNECVINEISSMGCFLLLWRPYASEAYSMFKRMRALLVETLSAKTYLANMVLARKTNKIPLAIRKNQEKEEEFKLRYKIAEAEIERFHQHRETEMKECLVA